MENEYYNDENSNERLATIETEFLDVIIELDLPITQDNKLLAILEKFGDWRGEYFQEIMDK